MPSVSSTHTFWRVFRNIKIGFFGYGDLDIKKLDENLRTNCVCLGVDSRGIIIECWEERGGKTRGDREKSARWNIQWIGYRTTCARILPMLE